MHKGKSVKYQPKKHIQAGIKGHINITSTFTSFFLFFSSKLLIQQLFVREKQLHHKHCSSVMAFHIFKEPEENYWAENTINFHQTSKAVNRKMMIF